MDLDNVSEALPDASTLPQCAATSRSVRFAPKLRVIRLSIRVKSESPDDDTEDAADPSPRSSLPSSAAQASKTPIDHTSRNNSADIQVLEGNIAPHILLARLTPPPEPITSFTARALPPYEPKMDKYYCIYVHHNFEFLKPIFTHPCIDAADLFSALTGHKIPHLFHPDYRYEMWFFERRSVAYLPYLAFEKDLARGEVLVSRVPGANGEMEWSRLEFGRELRNRGMNYHANVRAVRIRRE